MTSQFHERRRAARAPVDSVLEFRLERSVRVRVLDLSTTGALLWSEEDLPVGSQGRLTLLPGGMCFEGYVVITRDEPAGSGSGRRLGAALLRSGAGQQHVLEQFLRHRGPARSARDRHEV